MTSLAPKDLSLHRRILMDIEGLMASEEMGLINSLN